MERTKRSTIITGGILLACASAACGGTVHPAPDQTLPPAHEPEPQPADAAAVSAIPEGYHAITPSIVVPDLPGAIAFYERALGATQTEVMAGPDGAPMHGEMHLGDSVVMLSPENEQHGNVAPGTAGGTNGGLMVYVPDVDAAFAQALEAGATQMMPPADMFWGDRYGQLTDPYGHRWSLATHKYDVPPDEMQRRAQAWAAAMGRGEEPPAVEALEPAAASHQPAGWPTVIPAIVVASADEVDFYVQALGAEEVNRMAMPDGKLAHAELRIGDSILMLTGENAEMDAHMKAPSSMGGRAPLSVMIYVDDVDAVHARAIEAGATEQMPPTNMFWGDRFGQVRTSSGNAIGIATHVEDLTPAQMQERMRAQLGG
jgi:uncharacterized glyoxalase superfamily protein PhnB